MKIKLFLLLLLAWSYSSSQINVGPKERVTMAKVKFEEGDLEALKKTKTIFVFREQNIENLGVMKKAFLEAWDFTELIFKPYKEFKFENYGEGYSFFTMGGIHIERKMESISYSNTHIYLTLWMKGDDDERKIFARSELYPTYKTYSKASANAAASVDKEYIDMIDYLYEDATLHNWHIGQNKNVLQLINQHLSNAEGRWLFESDKGDLSPLKKATLYVPEYVKIKFDKFSGDESERHDMKKLFKGYPYKYKIIPTDELSAMILHSEEPVYYLTYIKSSTDKYLTVTNSKTGEILYSKYTPTSYNIKDKDIKRLAKNI